MPNIPEPQRADMPAFPGTALDALLAGDVRTQDAAAGLQPVAALLAALTAPPQGGELAGHARALAQFRRQDGMPAHSPHTLRRRSRVLTSLLSVKAAAAAVAAVAAVGGVTTAAFAGALPAPAQQFAHNTIGAPSPKPSHSPAATPSGPDATGPAAFGLCTAYTHAKTHGTTHQKAVALRNLAAAAGGAANITAYCATVPHPGSSQASAAASAAASHAASHPTGKPTSHPVGKPSSAPTSHPTGKPTSLPTSHPTGKPATAPAHN